MYMYLVYDLYMYVRSSKLTWLAGTSQRSSIFDRKYIFKMLIFQPAMFVYQSI